MHVWCSSLLISKIAPPRVINCRNSHSRRKTDGRVSSWALSHINLVCDINASFGETDGGHDPTTTAASKTLPCKFADIGPADGIGASEASREGGIVGVCTICCICASLSSILGREETWAHPGQGVEENMATIGGCWGLGSVLLFLLMRDDEWSRCQFCSVLGFSKSGSFFLFSFLRSMGLGLELWD